MSKSILLILVLLVSVNATLLAQLENTGSVVNDGVIDGYPGWKNTELGTYLGREKGQFNHSGANSLSFTNNGSYNTLIGHRDVFIGPLGRNGEIEIGGTKRPNFHHLDFLNGGGQLTNITNTEGIGIGGILNFRNGITKTDRARHYLGAIAFEPGASYLSATSNEQHVDGYVSKKGNTPFIFPVGSGRDIRILEVGASSNITANICVAWIAGNPSLTADPSDIGRYHSILSKKGSIESVSEVGQWDLIYMVRPENSISVSVSIPDLSNFSSAENLRLVGWDGTGWIDLSHNATATSNREGARLSGILPNSQNVSAIGIGSTSSALPVKFISFDASVSEQNTVELNWKTENEVNNKYFDVEHSLNGIDFEKVGRVESRSVFSESVVYSFVHNAAPTLGLQYYRIRQVDQDGSTMVSSTKSVEFKESDIVLFPNPAREKLYIQLANWKELESVEMIDFSGRTIVKSNPKYSVFEIATEHLPPGTYLIRLNYRGRIVRIKKVLIE